MDTRTPLAGVSEVHQQPAARQERAAQASAEEPVGEVLAQRVGARHRLLVLKGRADVLVWGRRRASARCDAEKGIADLRKAVNRLGVCMPVPRSVHLAVRRVHAGRSVPFRFVQIVLTLYGAVWTWPVLRALGKAGAMLWRKGPDPSTWSDLAKMLRSWTSGAPDLFVGPAVLYLVLIALPVGLGTAALIYFGPLVAGFLALCGRYPGPLADVATGALASRYSLTVIAAEAVVACGDAYGAGNGGRGAERMRNVGSALRDVEAAVWAARRTRGVTTTRRSHRRKALHRHAGQVVARLRAAEGRIDADPADALRELGGLLLTVAARYSEGRVGALLDETELADVTPARDRESLRLMAVAGLTVAGAVALSPLGLPDGAMGPAVGAVVVCAVALVYRRRALRMLEVLSPLSGNGGQR